MNMDVTPMRLRSTPADLNQAIINKLYKLGTKPVWYYSQQGIKQPGTLSGLRGLRGLHGTPFIAPYSPVPTCALQPSCYLTASPQGAWCAMIDGLRPLGSSRAEWLTGIKSTADPGRAVDNCDPYPIELGVGDSYSVQVFPADFNGARYFLGGTVNVTAAKNGAHQFSKAMGTLVTSDQAYPNWTTVTIGPFTSADIGDWQLMIDVDGNRIPGSVGVPVFRVSAHPRAQGNYYTPGEGAAPPQQIGPDGTVQCYVNGAWGSCAGVVGGGSGSGSGSGSGGSGSGSAGGSQSGTGGGSTGGAPPVGNTGGSGSTGSGGSLDLTSLFSGITQNELLIGGGAMLALLLVMRK